MMKQRMARIILSTDMLVGIELIDEQHRSLVALFNNLIDRLNEGLSEAERDDTVGRLFEYTKYHFTAEERIMESCGYATRHVHGKQHDAFVMNLKDLARNRELSQESLVELAQFLSKWIQHHILIADKEIGAFISGDAEPTGEGEGLKAEVERFVKGDPTSAKAAAIGREIAAHRMWVTGKAEVDPAVWTAMGRS